MIVSSDAATALSLTSPILGFKLDAFAETSTTLQNPNANSGEGEVWQLSIDVTSYFTANWTGTSTTWYASFTGTGPAFCNHSAKITITYQYEESTSNTQIKTIRIPIESTRTLLSNAYQTVGGTLAIPPLQGTYLPETGITIRQIFLDLQTFEATPTNNTNYTGTVRIGGTTTYDFWRYGCGNLQSARWAHSYVSIVTALTGSTYYELAAISTSNNRFSLLGGTINCTYEYNATGSTTIYNSLILGGVDQLGWIGGITAANKDTWNRDIYIEEPTTISIKESGVGLYFIDSGGFTLNVAVTGSTSGQTTPTSYVVTAASVNTGQYSLFHRVDFGGQNGKGLFLQRGKNNYNISVYSDTDQAGWNLSGQLILNYTSSKYSGGVGAHAHTCFQYIMSDSTITHVQKSNNQVACYIPETNYYLVGYVNYGAYTIAAGLDQSLTLSAEILSGETIKDGWLTIYQGQGRADNENSNGTFYSAARTSFTRWNGDPDPDRLNLKSARTYRLDSIPNNYAYFGIYYTYNNITYTLSGTCTYSGGVIPASGVTIKIHRNVSGSYDDTILSNLTSDSNGVYSGTWIDNTNTVYSTGYLSESYVGRSDNVISTSNMDMIIRNPKTDGNFNIVLFDALAARRIFIIS